MTRRMVEQAGLQGWPYVDRALQRQVIDQVGSSIPSMGPVRLQLDITSYCVANCRFCRTGQPALETHDHLTLREIERTVDRLSPRGLRVVAISGGEPLAHPEFCDIMRLFAERRLTVEVLVTTGQLLDEARVGSLLDADAREVQVSLNYTDPSDYAYFMGTPESDFQKVVDGLNRLTTERDRRGGGSRVCVHMFYQKANTGKLRRFFGIAAEAGVDTVRLVPLWGCREEQVSDEERAAVWRDEVAALAGAAGEGSQPDLELLVPDLRDLFDVDRGHDSEPPQTTSHEFRFCSVPWYSAVIYADGRVLPCSTLGRDPAAVLGSIREQDIVDIWRGKEYRRLRREVLRALFTRRKGFLYWKSFRRIRPATCAEQCSFRCGLFSDGDYEALADRHRHRLRALHQGRLHAEAFLACVGKACPRARQR